MSAAIRITSVRLADGASGAGADRPVWVQIATEGTYKGYQGGALEFTFDAALFNKVIANFRNSPSYVRGANGVGSADVIAWDFHHASEMPANGGSIPALGAPAQGWIQELEARRGADGKVTLWALTKWGPLARDYIKAGQYKWASVSITFDAVDPVSGKRIGPVLTSVALTNQPFIEGMQALAASRFGISTQQSKGPNMNTDTKAAIINRARQLRSTTPTVAMALSKAAAELCPRLTHDERWTQYVHPLLAQHGLEVVRHAVSQGAQLSRAPRQSLPGTTSAPQNSNVSNDGRPVLDVSAQPGPNPFAKLLSHVSALNPGKPYDTRAELAMQLNRSHRIVA